MDPAGAPVYGYRLCDTDVVDLELKFGWRRSLGFGGHVAAALEHPHNHALCRGARPNSSGIAASNDVVILENIVTHHSQKGTVEQEGKVAVPKMCSSCASSVDDGIAVEVQWLR